ncbi:hypothetical protein [Chitinibacter sp. S2-10]|uniref:hypothetical protein n=1 Tax=Chitinibacter sp. S2-10 TaxID=3373597 RepID=UPI0039779518
MADQKKPPEFNPDEPLFTIMDELMARHRQPSTPDNDIPILTEIAPKSILGQTGADADIPALTDVVTPHLADKITALEREWRKDHYEADISHLDREIAAPERKNSSAQQAIEPLPFRPASTPDPLPIQPSVAAAPTTQASPSKRPAAASPIPSELPPLLIPEAPKKKPPEPAAASPFLDLPMLDLDELSRAPAPDYLDLPVLPSKEKRDQVNTANANFIATDLVLPLDELATFDVAENPDFEQEFTESSQIAAEIPQLDLDALQNTQIPVISDDILHADPDPADESHAELGAEIVEIAEAVAVHETEEVTGETVISEVLSDEQEPSTTPVETESEIDVIELNDVSASETGIQPEILSLAVAAHEAAPQQVAVQIDPHTDEAKPNEALVVSAAHTTPDDDLTIELIEPSGLQWDDDTLIVSTAISEQSSITINLDEDNTCLIESAAALPSSPSMANLHQDAITDDVPGDKEKTEGIPPESLLDNQQESIPVGITQQTLSDITASVGAQLAIDMVSEVEKLTRQHLDKLMSKFYQETLSQLTEQISQDLEERLAPRIAELIEAELRSKGLL